MRKFFFCPNYALDVIAGKMAQEKGQADVILNIDMLRAGVRALSAWDGTEEAMDEVVTSIFYEMLAHRGYQPPDSSAIIASSNSATLGESTK